MDIKAGARANANLCSGSQIGRTEMKFSPDLNVWVLLEMLGFSARRR